jgi:hypothetical protein
VRVAAGYLAVVASGSGLFGAFGVPNDASLTSPAITATSTNGRKDRLILRVTAGVAALEIVQGTASGSPAEPAITGDNFLELALITLPASTTNITDAMITDRRVFVGKWSRPWGIIGTPVSVTTPTSHGAGFANQTGFAKTFTAVAGRRYRFKARFHLDNSSTGGVSQLQFADGGSAIAGSTANYNIAVGAAVILYFDLEWVGTLTAGSHTITLQAKATSGSGTTATYADGTFAGQLVVEDVGPATSNPD